MNGDAATIKRRGYMHCWLSGYTPSVRPEHWHGPWLLEIAHIASGAGRARRVNDRRAVILLCSLCHRVHVSDSDAHPWMSIASTDWPTIDERHALWLKRECDPEYYDPEFLSTIWIGKVPEPVKPPAIWNNLYYCATGIIR